jgi:hypothetical protein
VGGPGTCRGQQRGSASQQRAGPAQPAPTPIARQTKHCPLVTQSCGPAEAEGLTASVPLAHEGGPPPNRSPPRTCVSPPLTAATASLALSLTTPSIQAEAEGWAAQGGGLGPRDHACLTVDQPRKGSTDGGVWGGPAEGSGLGVQAVEPNQRYEKPQRPGNRGRNSASWGRRRGRRPPACGGATSRVPPRACTCFAARLMLRGRP